MKKNITNSIKKNMLFQITYFAEYVPAMKILNNQCTIKMTDIKDDTFNMVMNANFIPTNANQKIDEIIAIFRNRKIPFSWWVGPRNSPHDLIKRLEYKGFIHSESNHGMYLDLNNHNPQSVDRLRINQVSTSQELKEFDKIHVDSFGNKDAFDIIFSKIPPSAYQNKSPLRMYTGYVNDIAVATGMLVFHAGVVGIYYIVTLPAYRRKGYATEMMNYLLFIAKHESQRIAVLQASEEGLKVYEKMGFKNCCIFHEYTLKDNSYINKPTKINR